MLGEYADEASGRTTIPMFSRRVWYVACAAATVLAVGGIGAAFALKQPPGRASAGRAAVAYCELVACSVLPSHTTSTATADATATRP